MNTEKYTDYLALAWHQETARNSLGRWIDICKKENWTFSTEHMQVLIQIFGASWYFTRFVFVYGEKIIDLIETDDLELTQLRSAQLNIDDVMQGDDLEESVNRLRLYKNTMMFKILVAYLFGRLQLETLELHLTQLAEKVLSTLLGILQKKTSVSDVPINILGMGRMAGYEMTFGSDLDLIFLFEGDELMLNPEMSSIIRLLLRVIAQPSASGSLYEVDMRLRPHGNSGPLVTTYKTFLDYHESERDVWERQIMTRCRPVLARGNNIDEVMSKLSGLTYVLYDDNQLKSQIISMRQRVEKAFGSHRSKFEIKRGAGGIMDIDFITHYFQLSHGYKNPQLRTPSTRQAIRELPKLNIIDTEDETILLDAYNFLKRIETCLRLFDLKSVDTFATDDETNIALARAAGFGDNTRKFLENYVDSTSTVRQKFSALVGDYQ